MPINYIYLAINYIYLNDYTVQHYLHSLFNRKKLSNFTKTRSWKHAGNHVAKRYINEVPRQTYFSDVVLQMDAKLWGEEYDRHFPPKKVQ